MAQTDIIRRTSQLLSEGELVRKKQFFCIAPNSTRNSLIVLFYPIHELYRVERTFTAVKRKNHLSSGSASLQTFQETDTKICETSVDYSETESNAGVCYELRIL